MSIKGTKSTKSEAKTGKRAGRRRVPMLLMAFAAAWLLWQGDAAYVFAQGTATVLAESGKIRQSPSTDSTVLASVKKDDTLTVTAQTTDSQGYTWYKVFVNDQTLGYVRADLVNVTGDIPAESSQAPGDTGNSQTSDSSTGSAQMTADSNNGATTQVAEEVPVTSSPSTALRGKTTDTVRVRKGPGTDTDVAGNAQSGTEVTILGESADGSGILWYQVSFTGTNGTVNGFIRNDLLEITEYVQETPAVETPAVETPAEAEVPVEEAPVAEGNVENSDYYLKYMENADGVMEWFLFDNIQGTSQSLPELLTAVDQIEANEDSEASQLKTLKIVTIVCAVIIVALIVVITLLVFKLRESYYEYEDDEEDEEDDEDEDEEDEDEDEDEEVVRTLPGRADLGKDVRVSAEAKTGGRPQASRQQAQDAGSGQNLSSRDRDVKKEEAPAGMHTAANANTNASHWKSKDFLEIDDDMEFEFLDL